MTCRCGCGGEALWLMTGVDYDPREPKGWGRAFMNEPACYDAAAYCEEAAHSLGLPFTKRLVPSPLKVLKVTATP